MTVPVSSYKSLMSPEEKEKYDNFCQAIYSGDRNKIDNLFKEIVNFDVFVVVPVKGESNNRKMCALQVAAVKGDERTVRLILSKGCEDKNIGRCLHHADIIEIKINAIIISDFYKEEFINDHFSRFNTYSFPLIKGLEDSNYCNSGWIFERGTALQATHLKAGVDLFCSQVLNDVTSALGKYISIPPLVSIVFDYYFDVSFERDWLEFAEKFKDRRVKQEFDQILDIFKIKEQFYAEVAIYYV